MSDEQPGAWFAYSWDMGAHPIGLFATEVEALRCALENYGHAKFWPFGAKWSDVEKT